VAQAVFLYLQARILGRHASTLEENKEIMKTQAETLTLIGQALNQQGRIMGEQADFHRSVDARVEKGSLLNLVLDAQTGLEQLSSMLSGLQQSVTSQQDRHNVSDCFDSLAGSVTQCQKAVLMAISPIRRESIFLTTVLIWRISNQLTTWKRISNTFGNSRRSTEAEAFFGALGNLTKSPEQANLSGVFKWGDKPPIRRDLMRMLDLSKP
jgi:hypothetical protein